MKPALTMILLTLGLAGRASAQSDVYTLALFGQLPPAKTGYYGVGYGWPYNGGAYYGGCYNVPFGGYYGAGNYSYYYGGGNYVSSSQDRYWNAQADYWDAQADAARLEAAAKALELKRLEFEFRQQSRDAYDERLETLRAEQVAQRERRQDFLQRQDVRRPNAAQNRERKAAGKLRLARQLLDGGRTDRARQWLAEIIDEYAGTSAADKAELLLSQL